MRDAQVALLIQDNCWVWVLDWYPPNQRVHARELNWVPCCTCFRGDQEVRRSAKCLLEGAENGKPSKAFFHRRRWLYTEGLLQRCGQRQKPRTYSSDSLQSWADVQLGEETSSSSIDPLRCPWRLGLEPVCSQPHQDQSSGQLRPQNPHSHHIQGSSVRKWAASMTVFNNSNFCNT